MCQPSLRVPAGGGHLPGAPPRLREGLPTPPHTRRYPFGPTYTRLYTQAPRMQGARPWRQPATTGTGHARQRFLPTWHFCSRQEQPAVLSACQGPSPPPPQPPGSGGRKQTAPPARSRPCVPRSHPRASGWSVGNPGIVLPHQKIAASGSSSPRPPPPLYPRPAQMLSARHRVAPALPPPRGGHPQSRAHSDTVGGSTACAQARGTQRRQGRPGSED